MTFSDRLEGRARPASSVRTVGDASSEPSSTTTISIDSGESCARALSTADVTMVGRFHVAMTTESDGRVEEQVVAESAKWLMESRS
jgi:hypothetical protein